jgi:hypothetical protein
VRSAAFRQDRITRRADELSARGFQARQDRSRGRARAEIRIATAGDRSRDRRQLDETCDPPSASRPIACEPSFSEAHRTWNRPEAAELAKLYALVAPNYAAVIESYEKARELVRRGAVR